MKNINVMSKAILGADFLMEEWVPCTHSSLSLLLQILCRIEAKKRLTHIASIDFPEMCKGNSMREKIAFPTNGTGSTGYPPGEKNKD